MKKHVFIINLAVVIAMFICTIGVVLLAHDTTSMLSRYENDITKSIRVANDLGSVNENVYHINSMLWQLLTTDDTEPLKEQIMSLTGATHQKIDALADSTETDGQKERVDRLNRLFGSFEEDIKQLFELDGAQAQSFMASTASEHIGEIEEVMGLLNNDVNEKYDMTLDRYELDITRGRVYRSIGLTAMAVTLVLAFIVVIIGSRRIVVSQDTYEKDNEDRVTNFQQNIINAMANLIESRDGETGEHVKRTCTLVYKLAKELQKQEKYKEILTDEYIDMLVKAAPLHDVGKIRVPDAVLQKPGKLTAEEFEVIKQHAADGGSIIYETMGKLEEKEYLEIAHDVATYHHEKWDGGGYPTGKKGENIPLCARIMAVADVYDALVSRRCYKDPIPMNQAIEIIDSCSGTQFDPAIVAAFDKIITGYSEEEQA